MIGKDGSEKGERKGRWVIIEDREISSRLKLLLTNKIIYIVGFGRRLFCSKSVTLWILY